MKMTIDKLETWREKVDLVAIRLKGKGFSFDERKFKKWLMSKEKMGYVFDELLIYRAWKIHQRLRKDYDNFTVIAGYEGTGKTTLAIDLCSYISEDFLVGD